MKKINESFEDFINEGKFSYDKDSDDIRDIFNKITGKSGYDDLDSNMFSRPDGPGLSDEAGEGWVLNVDDTNIPAKDKAKFVAAVMKHGKKKGWKIIQYGDDAIEIFESVNVRDHKLDRKLKKTLDSEYDNDYELKKHPDKKDKFYKLLLKHAPFMQWDTFKKEAAKLFGFTHVASGSNDGEMLEYFYNLVRKELKIGESVNEGRSMNSYAVWRSKQSPDELEQVKSAIADMDDHDYWVFGDWVLDEFIGLNPPHKDGDIMDKPENLDDWLDGMIKNKPGWKLIIKQLKKQKAL